MVGNLFPFLLLLEVFIGQGMTLSSENKNVRDKEDHLKEIAPDLS